MSYEEQIENLYKEFKQKKSNDIEVDKNIYRIRKRMLEIAIEERDKNGQKLGT
jgi:hypothetical protein